MLSTPIPLFFAQVDCPNAFELMVFCPAATAMPLMTTRQRAVEPVHGPAKLQRLIAVEELFRPVETPLKCLELTSKPGSKPDGGRRESAPFVTSSIFHPQINHLTFIWVRSYISPHQYMLVHSCPSRVLTSQSPSRSETTDVDLANPIGRARNVRLTGHLCATGWVQITRVWEHEDITFPQ